MSPVQLLRNFALPERDRLLLVGMGTATLADKYAVFHPPAAVQAVLLGAASVMLPTTEN